MMRKFEKLRGVTVLIAKDDRNARENLISILKAEGAEVITTFSGKQALELLMSQQPDILLCGVSLSDTAGCTIMQFWRALESARGAQQQLPAIAVTRKEHPLDLGQAHRVGFNNIISLDHCSRHLIAMVEQLLLEVRQGCLSQSPLRPISCPGY